MLLAKKGRWEGIYRASPKINMYLNDATKGFCEKQEILTKNIRLYLQPIPSQVTTIYQKSPISLKALLLLYGEKARCLL